MNPYLAQMIFAGETIYNVKSEVKIKQEPTILEKTLLSGSDLEKLVSHKKLVVLTSAIRKEEKEILGKILNAASFTTENTHLFDINAINKKISIGNETIFVLSFAIDLKTVGIFDLFDLYSPKDIGKQTILMADALEALVENKNNEKLKLWAAMKQMFHL